MGQRSQIYIKIGNNIIANHYQWNYGERMVSRARYLIEWLQEFVDDENLEWLERHKMDDAAKIADVNFDMIDIQNHRDLISEWRGNGGETSFNDYIFNTQNNDGKLFVLVTKEGVKFALTDSDNRIFTPREYMLWDCADESEDNLNQYLKKYVGSKGTLKFWDNISNLSLFKNLTDEELENEFFNFKFENEPKRDAVMEYLREETKELRKTLNI